MRGPLSHHSSCRYIAHHRYSVIPSLFNIKIHHSITIIILQRWFTQGHLESRDFQHDHCIHTEIASDWRTSGAVDAPPMITERQSLLTRPSVETSARQRVAPAGTVTTVGAALAFPVYAPTTCNGEQCDALNKYYRTVALLTSAHPYWPHLARHDVYIRLSLAYTRYINSARSDLYCT